MTGPSTGGYCDEPGPFNTRCWLAVGHRGEHVGEVRWAAADDAPTEKFPPIQTTVRRRPPVPEIRELKGAELLRALADEIERDPDLPGGVRWGEPLGDEDADLYGPEPRTPRGDR